jgi:hypothetical protein
MEVLLNLAWLLVAIVALARWLSQSRRRASGATGLCLQFIALVCALALLFPAISATDDLHAAKLAVEASDVARKVLRSMNTVSSSGAVDWLHFLPAVLLLALLVAPRRKFICAIPEAPRVLPRTDFFSLLPSRAPPPPFSA